MNEIIYFIKTFETPIFTIIGTITGAIFGNMISYYFNIKTKKNNNKIISFSKLMSLKNPWIQSIQTNGEARLLCEFYETRYLLFSKNHDDLNEAKKQNERHLELIKEISNYQKDFFEALGIMQTCFNINSELQKTIDEIFNYSSIGIENFPKSFKDIEELDLFLKNTGENLKKLINIEYKNKIDGLLILLKKQL